MSQSEEKRKYFRVQLQQPLCCQLIILSIKGEKVASNSSTVQVHDIGAGGLKFTSRLKFPLNPFVLFQFDCTILEERVSLTGKIVRREETEENGYAYGVSFILNEAQMNTYIRLFNELSIRQHRKQSLHGTSLCPLTTSCVGCSCLKKGNAS